MRGSATVSDTPRARSLLVVLLTLAACHTAACHTPPSPRRLSARPPPRSSQADAPCARLAEAVVGVAYDGQVLAQLSRAPRAEADRESLLPLEACLSRFAEPRWATRPWLLRSVAHAYGLVVVDSTTLDRADKARRLARLPLDDVAAYWSGRLLEREGAFAEAASRYREALEVNPSLVGARLALAGALVRAGSINDGLAALDEVPADARPALVSLLRGEAYRARGDLEEAERHYAAALAGSDEALGEPAPDGAALASLPLPGAPALACALGGLREARGNTGGAIGAYRQGACPEELARVLRASGRTFDVLVDAATRDAADLEALAELYEALGARRSAIDKRLRLLEMCERLAGGARCDAHRQRLSALEGDLPVPSPSSAGHEPGLGERRSARDAAVEAIVRAHGLEGEAAAAAGDHGGPLWLGDVVLSDDERQALVEYRLAGASGAVHLVRGELTWRVEALSGAGRYSGSRMR